MKTIDISEIKKLLVQHYTKVNKELDECFDPDVFEYWAEQFGYLCPEVKERYVDDVIIDGEEYERRAGWYGEMLWSFYGAPCFLFYSLYRIADIPNHKVSEYQASRKLYSVEIDKEDFPPAFFPED